MNKFLLFILLLSFTFISKGQEVIDSSETVMLEVRVFDEDSVTPLDSVKVSIYGTDGSTRTFFTDSIGFITIELSHEIAYAIHVIKNTYLNGKSKLDTRKNQNKKKYISTFYLEKIKTTGCFPFPKFDYSENIHERIHKNSEKDCLSATYGVMVENPTIVLELIAVRSKNEQKKISKKRAEKIINELVAQGIEKDRLVFKDGGVGENEKEEDNRYVVFKVLKTDYVSKGSKK